MPPSDQKINIDVLTAVQPSDLIQVPLPDVLCRRRVGSEPFPLLQVSAVPFHLSQSLQSSCDFHDLENCYFVQCPLVWVCLISSQFRLGPIFLAGMSPKWCCVPTASSPAPCDFILSHYWYCSGWPCVCQASLPKIQLTWILWCVFTHVNTVVRTKLSVYMCPDACFPPYSENCNPYSLYLEAQIVPYWSLGVWAISCSFSPASNVLWIIPKIWLI